MIVMKAKNSTLLACILLGCIAGVFCGCRQQSALAPDAYLHWVDDPANGLVQEQKIGDFVFMLQYRPAEYMTVAELLENEHPVSRALFDSVREEYAGMQYYLLKIGSAVGDDDFLKQSARSQEEYLGRIQYFSSDVIYDLMLVDGPDTLSCAMHHFERSYSVGSFNTLLLAFQGGKNTASDKVLIFNDKVLGTGPVRFTIPATTFTHIPSIEL
jgi:hypothetical protein